MADTSCVGDPISDSERKVLLAYAEYAHATGAFRLRNFEESMLSVVDPQAVVDRLVERGLLQRHERGAMLTPEGMAAALS